MDYTVDIENNIRLNVRAAGIVKHGNKILIHNNQNRPNYAFLGGRVKILEDSKTAVKREFEEELGYKMDVIKFLTVVENYYDYKDKKVHEIMLPYELELQDDEMKKKTDTLYNVEGKDYLEYDWLTLDEIRDIDLRPKALKEYLLSDEKESRLVNFN